MSSAVVQKIETHQFTTSLREEEKAPYRKLLSLYSDSKFEDFIWNIDFTISDEKGKLSYSSDCSPLEDDIIKVTVLGMIAAGNTINTCSRRIRDLYVFYDFLADNNYAMELLSQPIIDRFHDYIEHIESENWRRNQYMQSLQSLVEECSKFSAFHFFTSLDVSRRWKDNKQPKRAPDSIVVEQLDRKFFDMDAEIPLAYRALYISLRLRTHRISEVLAASLDCISYPDKDVFTVLVPTRKETAYHVSDFHKYHFLLNGTCEAIYHTVLRRQLQYATSMQEKLKEKDRGYLFVHPTLSRLVTTADFNKYLANYCNAHKILDSEQSNAKITSHDFRHIAVCERLQSNVISPEQTMVECNHSSMEETMGYGYQSKHDETNHLKEIVVAAHPLFQQENVKYAEPRLVPEVTYSRFENQPTTRVIPGYGLCLNRNCKPQYERCFQCDAFNPNPEYKDYFISAIKLLLKKTEMIEKKHGDSVIAQQNAKHRCTRGTNKIK